MYKKIRKSVADVISSSNNPEQFSWNKWLKEPQVYLEKFPKPKINILSPENFRSFEQPALYQVKKFALTKFKLSEDFKNVIIKKRKTFKLFFNFSKPINQKVNIFSPDAVKTTFLLSIFQKEKELFIKTRLGNKEQTISLTPKTDQHNIKLKDAKINLHKPGIPKVKFVSHICSMPMPTCVDLKTNLNLSLPPDKIFKLNILGNELNHKISGISFNPLEKVPPIKQVPVNSLEQVKAELNKSGGKNILHYPIEDLDQKPKLFRVKSFGFEKLKIQLYHLKNLDIKQAKQNRIKLEEFKESINAKKDLISLIAQGRVKNPGLFDKLNPPYQIELEKEEKQLKPTTESIEAISEAAEEISVHPAQNLIESEKPCLPEILKSEVNTFDNLKDLELPTEELIQESEKPSSVFPQEHEVKAPAHDTEPVTENKKTSKVSEKETKTFNWEKIESDFKHLTTYQKDGIKLLLNNKNALLCDEIGIDKKSQVVHALTAAIKADAIHNVLVVCPDAHIGSIHVAEAVSNSDGWENHIFKINRELKFTTVKSIAEELKFESIRSPEIFITNYKTFNALTNSPDKKIFINMNIDCLILDEVQNLMNGEIEPDQLFNFPDAKYLWIISSLPPQILEEHLIPKLRNHLPGFSKLDGSLSRTKFSLSGELPLITRNDFWHELDAEQSQEFENTLNQGRKRILDLVKGGNPFIIQSNIFTLIHQVKQLGNFSTHKETSPKSELLLDQLESIIASGQKCIIFSQYDKQGVQKIEKLLKNNQIRYVLYQSAMPLKELENSTNALRNDQKISVMIASLTAASVKVKIPEAPYLIHFDQWWNPITQWQYEDKIINTDDMQQSSDGINVINYFSNNSVELNIRATLERKGLLTRNLIEFLSNETIYSLITNEDWLDILGIEHTKSRKNQKPNIDEVIKKLSESSLEENGQRTKNLFTKLGYKNLMMKPDMLNKELTIYGYAQKGLHEYKTAIFFLPSKAKKIEPVQNFIREASKNNSRLFVICADELLHKIPFKSHEKIVYIGESMLANYLSLFNIN